MTGRIRVGLIGLGEVAQLMHLPLLADDPRFEIAAVTDVSPSLVEHVAGRYGVAKRPASAAALIADPQIDAVFILAPDHLHAELLERAMRAKKHVFQEKPAALTAAELRPLVELDRTNDHIVFVGYMRRYAPAFLALRQRLPPREEIRHVRVRDIIRESQFFIDETRSVFRPKDVPAPLIAEGRARTEALVRSVVGKDAAPEVVRSYQVLTGMSSHALSAMRELFGLPLGVVAARQHRGENVVALFDYGSFTAVYEGIIHEVARFDSGIEVLTMNQHFKINYDTPYVRFLPTRLEITTSGLNSTGSEVIGPFYRDSFATELGAFHHAVTTGEKPKTNLADSLLDLELFARIAGHFGP